MLAPTKDVTATSANLQVVKVNGGMLVARLTLLDDGGIAMAGAVLNMPEFRDLIQRFVRSYREATGSSPLL